MSYVFKQSTTLNPLSDSSTKRYFTKYTTITTVSGKQVFQFANVPANRVFVAITKGGSAYHLFAAYTTAQKTIQIPVSGTCCYYNYNQTYTNNSSFSDREIMYICDDYDEKMVSISMDGFANATDLTSIYMYLDNFKLTPDEEGTNPNRLIF